MKILFILEMPFEPSKGGVQQSTYKLATIFHEAKHQVKILSFFGNRGVYDKKFGFEVFYAGEIAKSSSELISFFAYYLPDVCINQMGYSTRITDLVRKSAGENVKLINTLRINPLNFIQNSNAFLKGYLEQRNMGFLYSDIFLSPLQWYHRIKQYLNHQYVLNRVDAYVMLNNSFIEELSYFWIDTEKYSNKLFAIPNPFREPDDPIDLDKKENIILFVGRLNKIQKRVDLLMEIWQQLHPILASWQFWVVGDGPERSWMEKYCRDHGMDRVQFFGFDTPDSYYRKAKILHFTSAYEGFGNVLVEAQQHGAVPILFNSYSAASEIVWDGKNGLVIEPFNVEEYYTKTLNLINDQDRWKEMASNAGKDVERYNYKAVREKWSKLFSLTAVK